MQNVEEIVAAVEKYDVDAFTQAVVDYDSISKLDNWKTKVLLKIKQGLQGNSGGGGDDENKDGLR